MKKIVAFLMILSLSVFTVGCGNKEGDKTPADKTPAADGKTDDGGHAEEGTKTDDGGTVGEKTDDGGTEMP